MAKMYAKRLYESNREKRKLENKIQDMESVLSACKTKCNISDESLEVLKRAASEVPRELLARAVKKIKCSYTPNYSPVIKKFALTLHLYSPAAYRYDMYYVLCIAVYLDFWRGGGKRHCSICFWVQKNHHWSKRKKF